MQAGAAGVRADTCGHRGAAAPNGNWPNGFAVTFNTGETVSFNHCFDILVSSNLSSVDQRGAQAHDSGTGSLGLTLTDFSQAAFYSDALPLPVSGLTLAMFTMSKFKYDSRRCPSPSACWRCWP